MRAGQQLPGARRGPGASLGDYMCVLVLVVITPSLPGQSSLMPQQVGFTVCQAKLTGSRDTLFLGAHISFKSQSRAPGVPDFSRTLCCWRWTHPPKEGRYLALQLNQTPSPPPRDCWRSGAGLEPSCGLHPSTRLLKDSGGRALSPGPPE